jgi:hypothetical protein
MNEKEKILALDWELKEIKKDMEDALERLKKAENRLVYYDKMALKAGFFSMGFLCFGAALSMGFDRLKDKLIAWLLP